MTNSAHPPAPDIASILRLELRKARASYDRHQRLYGPDWPSIPDNKASDELMQLRRSERRFQAVKEALHIAEHQPPASIKAAVEARARQLKVCQLVYKAEAAKTPTNWSEVEDCRYAVLDARVSLAAIKLIDKAANSVPRHRGR